ncbi:hypothetical protein H6F77_01000 [Microcoleus sp. FACHB-831]|jgi:hypothetical protein|uniref:hypothetical protein n=1 Tax=Microcoleus sp. FACHB-831 TaxID=2692827 RepID=UPI001685646D|nr:hypothetical protein [Microcoleus sp. FACHB-831]MBD1919699.1 hypothetical protein [Microcoleus sp. FACHB-831]
MRNRRLPKNILVLIVGRRRMHFATKSIITRLFAYKMSGTIAACAQHKGIALVENGGRGELHLIKHFPIEGDRTKSIKV